MAAPKDGHLTGAWTAPETLSHEELVAASDDMLGRPDIAFSENEHIFRIKTLGLDWDMGVMVYRPV
ncbi:MAG: hypothetical protein HQ494_06345, partial [Rhodospirillales bacterium]|nr:hypothetical protein [Rhodospirillales bacterium]